MKDALGKDLKLGQRVAVPCNSRFKIGVLYRYKPNDTKWFRTCQERVRQGDEHSGYYRLYIENHPNLYYVRFENGKTRTVSQQESIIGLPDDASITI